MFVVIHNLFGCCIDMSIARAYPNAISTMPPNYTDYENAQLEWQQARFPRMLLYSSQDRYQIIKKVGRGKYSEVFKGVDMKTGEFVSIKYLKPVRFKKIKRYELFILDYSTERFVLCNNSLADLLFYPYLYILGVIILLAIRYCYEQRDKGAKSYYKMG